MRCPEDGAPMLLLSRSIRGNLVYVCPRCGRRGEVREDQSL